MTEVDGGLAEREWSAYLEPLGPLGRRLVAEMADPDDAQLRQEMYRLLLSGFSMSYIGLFLGDSEHPDFWPILNMAYNWGNPNPDDAYYAAALSGGGVYRISGHRGSVKIIDFQIGGGEFYSRGGAPGPAYANYDIDDLKLGDDGRFEVVLSSEPPLDHTGNWWHLDPRSAYVLVRQRSYDWAGEVDGRLAIERLDTPAIRPRIPTDRMRENLRQMSVWAETWTTFVVGMVKRYRSAGLINKVAIADLGGEGGVVGSRQQYVQGIFQLEPDEALIYDTEIPEQARYWNVTLNDPNWSAVDYMNRQSSLNGHSARLDADGHFRAVIAAHDPGVPNWLDTAGYTTGTIFGRWLDCSGSPLPRLTKVKLADIRRHLPFETPTVTPAERDTALRLRRTSAQLRRRW